MFKTRGGWVKGRLNNVKKTALLVEDGFPNGSDNCGTFDDVGVKNEYTHKKISLEANDAPGCFHIHYLC